MKTLRAGVSRLREELVALLGVEAGEVAGPQLAGTEPPVPVAPVLVGTEAVLHRVRRAAAVAFLDIDLHLLAPRLSATEETMALFVRASRLVGARGTGAPSSRMQVQTRVPDHPLLQAIALGEPTEVLAEELEIRRVSGAAPLLGPGDGVGCTGARVCRGAAPRGRLHGRRRRDIRGRLGVGAG